MTQPRTAAAGLLHRYPRARCSDPDEFVHALNGVYGSSQVTAVTVPTRRESHELRALTGEGFAIGYIRSGIGVRLTPSSERGPLYLNLTYTGALRATTGGDELLNDPELATVISSQAQRLTPVGSDTQTVGIKFDEDLVDAELAGLLGHEPDGPVRFAPGLDLTTAAGSGIAALARMVLAEADRPAGGLFDHPAVRLHYFRTLLVGLLTTHQHSFTEALSHPDLRPRPRALRLALEYLDANLAAPLTLADLAAAAGCGARTLHGHFQEHLGRSPMGHLKELRLERVHRELRRSGRPVTEVAYGAGFTHLGRFSASYRDRYGVLPSQTARGR